MRTTEDLIRELDHEAGNFTHCALVVGFEDTTVFVWGHDLRRQSTLDEAVKVGGKPVGMIGCDTHNGLVTVQARTLEEYAEKEWAADYLVGLTDKFRRSILTTGEAQEINDPTGRDMIS